MNTKKVTLTQGDKTYEIKGLLGCVAQSKERNLSVQNGDVRYIGGMLMYAYTIERARYFSLFDTVSWALVDDKATYENIQKWVKSL